MKVVNLRPNELRSVCVWRSRGIVAQPAGWKQGADTSLALAASRWVFWGAGLAIPMDFDV